MSDRELENWKKIKNVMEESGKTDTVFYRRAIEILKTGKDPLSKFLGSDIEYTLDDIN